LYGLSIALLAEAELGLMPWSVLEQGLARTTGGSLGTLTIVVGALVLLAWIPLRQRPGVGTVSNVVVIGVVLDACLAVLPPVESLPVRVALVLAGTVLNAVATAAYVGARLGPGPRDGLMTGLVRCTGRPVRQVRTGLEVSVVLLGVALGGVLGPGTVVYALAIGPLVQPLLPLLVVPVPDGNTGAAHELHPEDPPPSALDPKGPPCPPAPPAPPGTAPSRPAPARSS